MPIQFICSQCQYHLSVPDENEGKVCRCSHCGFLQNVPAASVAMNSPLDGSSNVHGGAVDATNGETPVNPFASPLPEFGSSQATPDHAHPSTVLQPAAGESRSGLVLGLGIIGSMVSLFSCGCCFIFSPLGLGVGIASLMIGVGELKAAKSNPNGGPDDGVLLAGTIFGGIATGISLLVILYHVLIIVTHL